MTAPKQTLPKPSLASALGMGVVQLLRTTNFNEMKIITLVGSTPVQTQTSNDPWSPSWEPCTHIWGTKSNPWYSRQQVPRRYRAKPRRQHCNSNELACWSRSSRRIRIWDHSIHKGGRVLQAEKVMPRMNESWVRCMLCTRCCVTLEYCQRIELTLQQNSQLRQHNPIFPLHPKQSLDG